ncbi:hypothetical protein VKT23_013968 [Stygiomarasmius scandens]|uniref:Uncharacterized protein n=1 Tax=Marasmiellus scandens TaxID=2682957 RepID=A0ABR1J6M2_9AGAR
MSARSVSKTSKSSRGSSVKEKDFKAGTVIVLPVGITPIEGSPFFELCEPVSINAGLIEHLKMDGLGWSNEDEGIVIPLTARYEDIQSLISMNLPRLYNFLLPKPPISNPFYNSLTDSSDRETVPLFHLCIRVMRNAELAPSVRGVFPDGAFIARLSKSKSKIAWEENVIVFACHYPVPNTLRSAWSRGQDPDPISFRSPSPDLPLPSEIMKGKGKIKARATTPSGSELSGDDKKANKKDNADEEFEGMAQALRESRISSVRVTRSMTQSAGAGPSTMHPPLEPITISSDSSDYEDTLISGNQSSPYRFAPLAHSRMAREFTNSKSNPFTSAPKSFEF